MKLSANEFIKKYIEEKKIFGENDDAAIEMMEDITDSINVDTAVSEENAALKAENEKLAADLIDLKERYKMRFMQGDEIIEEKVEDKVEDELVKEKEVIDIEEI